MTVNPARSTRGRLRIGLLASTHRRKVSDSHWGSALNAPDELEAPRSCGIYVPMVAYQIETRLALQLVMVRLTLDKGRICNRAFKVSTGDSTSHNGQRESV